MLAIYFLLQIQHLSLLDSRLNQEIPSTRFTVNVLDLPSSMIQIHFISIGRRSYSKLSGSIANFSPQDNNTKCYNIRGNILRPSLMALGLWILHLNKRAGRSGFWTIPLSPLLRNYLRLERQPFKVCGLSVMYLSSRYSISWRPLNIWYRFSNAGLSSNIKG